jgi:hypothetical protein
MKRWVMFFLIGFLCFTGCENKSVSSPATTTTSTTTSQLVAPTISAFMISPNAITRGETATLSWTVADAQSVQIDQGIGSVASSGNRAVSPSQDTTYTLTATNPGGTKTATTAITVRASVSGKWNGTSYSPGNGTNSLTFTLSQSGEKVTGTWSSPFCSTGTIDASIMGNTFSGTLWGQYRNPGTISGTVSNNGSRIDGTATDAGGAWTYTVIKQ